MYEEKQAPLATIHIEATVDKEWGHQLIEVLPGVLDQEVSEDQEDAFWVAVEFTLCPKTKFIAMNHEEKLCKELNQALGRELLHWRVETVYPQTDNSGLAGLLLLMNTVSLQDIMELGA